MDLCSVIVATYRSSHLAETLQSLIAQDYADLEILVLDDASDDSCRALVASFNDRRLRYLGNPRPLGVALNHQRGVEESVGDFIAVVNHDDLLAVGTLSKLIAALQADPSAAVAFAPPRVMDINGIERPERTEFAWAQWGMLDIPVGRIDRWTNVSRLITFQSIASVVYRRAAVERIPRSIGGSYDTWMAYRASRVAPVIHVPEAIGYWREHPGNLTLQRSWRRTYERVYLHSRVALDSAMPWPFRARAARSLPRALAATALDRFVRGRRVASR